MLVGKLSVVLATATALVGAAAVPASAAGTVAAAGGTAPACISRSVHSTLGYVNLHNGCGKTMRVKVIIDLGSDSSCYQMGNGASVRFWYGGLYNRTVVC